MTQFVCFKFKSSPVIFLLLGLLINGNHSLASSFFAERYRGWLWFEDKPAVLPSNNNAPSNLNTAADPEADSQAITQEQARAEIEQFAKELEELKFMMLARPTPENVKAYRDKEMQMWRHASALHDAWDMANLLYPEQRDLINNPVNVHAVKAKRAWQEEENAKLIKQFAKGFDLVLFFSESCNYCRLFSPVLKKFGMQYGFNIDAASDGNNKHAYFKTTNAPDLVKKLGISAFPTVIAVSKDAKTAFELIRGYVSASELEEYTLLAIKYLAGFENKERVENKLISEIR